MKLMNEMFTQKEMHDITDAVDKGNNGIHLPVDLRLRFKKYCKASNLPYPFKEGV